MWHDFKQIIKNTSGLSDVLLHIFLGLAIFIALLIVFRRPLPAILLTIAIQVINEIVDLAEDATGSGVYGSIADIFWTLLLPVMLFSILKVKALTRRPANAHPNE